MGKKYGIGKHYLESRTIRAPGETPTPIEELEEEGVLIKRETKWKLSVNPPIFTSLVDFFRKSGNMQDMTEFQKSKYAQTMIDLVAAASEGKISDVWKFISAYQERW